MSGIAKKKKKWKCTSVKWPPGIGPEVFKNKENLPEARRQRSSLLCWCKSSLPRQPSLGFRGTGGDRGRSWGSVPPPATASHGPHQRAARTTHPPHHHDPDWGRATGAQGELRWQSEAWHGSSRAGPPFSLHFLMWVSFSSIPMTWGKSLTSAENSNG